MHYERLVDGNFISEQLGRSKSAESFSSAVRAIWTTLHSDYGVMRIDFNEPLSIKVLIYIQSASITNSIIYKLIKICIYVDGG